MLLRKVYVRQIRITNEVPSCVKLALARIIFKHICISCVAVAEQAAERGIHDTLRTSVRVNLYLNAVAEHTLQQLSLYAKRHVWRCSLYHISSVFIVSQRQLYNRLERNVELKFAIVGNSRKLYRNRINSQTVKVVTINRHNDILFCRTVKVEL